MATSIPLVISLLMCVNMGLVQAQNSPEDYLRVHNDARRDVGVGPMKWDHTLENYAQKYANVRSNDCELIHSDGPYGENIYWGMGDGYSDGVSAVQYWINEKDFYDHNSNTCIGDEDCLHYTQIVWKDSVRLGCARSMCSYDRVFITCNYDPPGNYDGEKPY